MTLYTQEHDQYPKYAPPAMRTQSFAEVRAGVQVIEKSCRRCGCAWVNIGCPKGWPIDTVVLTCFKCGDVIEYVDGLLLITVKQYISDYTGRRPWVVKHRTALAREQTPSRGQLVELITMGRANGLSDEDIAEALDISVESVKIIR